MPSPSSLAMPAWPFNTRLSLSARRAFAPSTFQKSFVPRPNPANTHIPPHNARASIRNIHSVLQYVCHMRESRHRRGHTACLRVAPRAARARMHRLYVVHAVIVNSWKVCKGMKMKMWHCTFFGGIIIGVPERVHKCVRCASHQIGLWRIIRTFPNNTSGVHQL